MRDKPRRKSEARFRTLVGRPWQLWSDPRRPPCGDRKIGAHATAVCCSAAGLGWAEEDQWLLRPPGRQPGTVAALA